MTRWIRRTGAAILDVDIEVIQILFAFVMAGLMAWIVYKIFTT